MRSRPRVWLAPALTPLAVCAAFCAPAAGPGPAAGEAVEARRLAVRVVAEYPHDRESFTQGLLWHDGRLFESTGQYGSSKVRRVDLETGAAELQSELPEDLFGEGLARVGDRLYQLSWRAGRLLVYEVASLDLVDEKAYAGQGWGLCYTAPYLVRSDSTHTLVFHDAVSFEEVLRLPVTLDGEPLPLVNELECAEGWIYGNVWQQETIARIDPDSGHVVALIDASGLLTPAERKGTDVLNGIAYRPEAGTFLLTGKYWPKVFEVVFVEEESP